MSPVLKISIFLALLAIINSRSVPTVDVVPDGNATRITACEGQEAELICEPGTVIRVEIANFGRFSRTICLTEEELNDGIIYPNCLNDKSIEILRRKCNGERDCRQLAVLDDFGGNHPCPKTKNIYLELKYTCVHEETITTTTTPRATTLYTEPTTGSSGANHFLPSSTSQPKFCPFRIVHGIKYLRTIGGHTFTTTCMDGAEGHSSWFCSTEGQWDENGPNTTACVSRWTSTKRLMFETYRDTKDGTGMLELLRGLTQDTNRPMQAGDLPLLENLLDDIVRTLVSQRWTVSVRRLCNDKLVELINYVTKSSESWNAWPPDKRRQFGTRLLDHLEKVMAWSVGDGRSESSSLIYPQPTVIVQISDTQENLHGLEYISLPSVPIWDNQDSVDVPIEALRVTGSNARILFSTMSSMSSNLIPMVKIPKTKDNSVEISRRVVSNIVTASILDNGTVKRNIAFHKPIFINLVHTANAVEGLSNPQCSWWSEKKHAWFESGCEIRSHNDSNTVCACSHMTHFALLMDVRGEELSPFDNVILTYITYAGCSISILCLLLTLLCFGIFARSGGDRIFVHKNLCLTLAIAELLFLLGVWRTDDKFECSIIAGALLYFFLSSLTWMLLEGYQLYQMLVEVFPTPSRKFLFSVIGYGFPAVVTGTGVFIDPNGFGTSKHCWLRTENYFILVFVAPAAIILSLNIFFLFMTMCIVCKNHSGGYLPCRTESDIGRNIRIWVKSALAVSCLLGVTWTLGLLWIDGIFTVYVAYAFTVCNSMQGFSIFLFHVVLSEKMRNDIIRWMSRRGCCEITSQNKNQPRSALSPSGGSGSGTGSDFLYPSSDKYTTSPRTMDTRGSYPYARDLMPNYQCQMVHHPHQGIYDYATIAYGEMLPGKIYRTPPSFYRSPYNLRVLSKEQHGVPPPPGQHRPPPEFSPPSPPAQIPRALCDAAKRTPAHQRNSDDSVYSDDRVSVLTTEITPTGATVLRLDISKN